MKNRKGLSSYTTLVKNENAVTQNVTVYHLYQTNILEVYPDKLKLNSGGWYTRHIKNCINDNLPAGYRVFQSKLEWYVETPNGVIDFDNNMVIEIN